MPWAPPVHCQACPPTGGKLGPEPEDFQVDEVPLYELSGNGQHLFVRLRKRGLTTQQLLKHVAKASGTRERDIGVAGQKDKHAVTTQWISLLAHEVLAPEEWQLPDEVSVVEVTRHDNKLRTGHVAGNRFRIRLVDVPNPEAAEPIRQKLAQEGMPNFFGAQRFGAELSNLDKAIRFLEEQSTAKSRRKPPRFITKLYPSVVQAEVFNRYVQRRLDVGLDQLLSGEVVRLEGSPKHFIVEDPQRELPRLAEKDIHLTGPIWGPKMLAPQQQALELEQAALQSLGLSEQQLAALAKLAPGARRDLLVHPRDLQARAETASDGRACLVLEFFLPSGAYATEVIRQFTHDEFAQVR